MGKFFQIKISKVKIDIMFFAAVLSAIIFGYVEIFAISFVSVLLHEMAHIAAARRLGVKISGIGISPFGVCACLSDGYIKSSEKEFFIAFSGPFLSAVLAVFALIFPVPKKEWIFEINFFVAAVNLIPALPLDGGRMMRACLAPRFGVIRASRIMLFAERILIFCAVPVLIYALFKTRLNFTFVLILAFLIENMFSGQKNVALITVREILENGKKTANFSKIKSFAADFDSPARLILRHISYDYYITVEVIKNCRKVGTLTESDVLSGILNLGIGSSFGSILEIETLSESERKNACSGNFDCVTN